jgi:hypothetical protein
MWNFNDYARFIYIFCLPIPVTVLSKVWVCGLVVVRVSDTNLAGGVGAPVFFFMRYVGKDLSYELITHSEEFCGVCLIVCDL